MTTAECATVIIAAIGCITGVTGFVKSLLADRRVRLEPYFRNVWSEVRSPLDSHMRIIHDLLDILGRSESQECLPLRPKAGVIPQIDNYDWAYDKRLYKLLKSCEGRIQQLDSVVDKYNKLLYPVTTDFAEWVKMKGIHEVAVKEAVDKGQKQQEELEEVRARNVERAETVLEIARRYIDPEKENVGDLKKSEDYQRDLSVLRARVQESIRELRHIMEDIQKRADFHTRRFS
jgi:hypothetical protein